MYVFFFLVRKKVVGEHARKITSSRYIQWHRTSKNELQNPEANLSLQKSAVPIFLFFT